MKKNIMFVCLFMLSNLANASNYNAIPYSVYPIDNKIHVLEGKTNNFSIAFNVNVINRNDDYGELQNATCTLTTNYKGKTGILIYIIPGEGYTPKYQGRYIQIILNNHDEYKYQIGGWTNQYFPYYAPMLQVLNEGCSTYGDGNICAIAKQTLNDSLYVKCSYNN